MDLRLILLCVFYRNHRVLSSVIDVGYYVVQSENTQNCVHLKDVLTRHKSEFCLVQKWAHFPKNSSGEFLPFLCTLILPPPTKLPLDINCVIAAFMAGIGSNYVCSKPSRSVINVIHDRAKWRCPPSLRGSTEGTWGWGLEQLENYAMCCTVWCAQQKSVHSTASRDVWTSLKWCVHGMWEWWS